MEPTYVIAWCHVAIVFTAGPIWFIEAVKYYNHKYSDKAQFCVVSLGAIVFILAFWRSYSFFDDFTESAMTAQQTLTVSMIIWLLCASISILNMVVYFRPEQNDEDVL